MPDGSRRPRRNGCGLKAKWYAYYRSLRFQRRYGFGSSPILAFVS